MEGEVVLPAFLEHPGAAPAGDLRCAVGRAGVDNDHLIDQRPQARQTPGKALLFILHDETGRYERLTHTHTPPG